MSQPCEQEQTINLMSQSLMRMEKSQEYIIDLLSRVANQSARIENLEDHKDTCIKSTDILFERVRDLELNTAAAGPMHRENVRTSLDDMESKIDLLGKKLDKLNRFFYFTTHKYACIGYASVLALIVIGTAMDIVYHWTTIDAIWHFWKGK
jgi:hypothetical protein